MFRKILWSVSWLSLRAVVNAEAQAPEITVDLPEGETMEMVWIPAGTFIMGATTEEVDSGRSQIREWPQHEVTISRGFYFGKYEVTQAQWTAVVGTNPWRDNCAQCPATSISWDDTQDFIHRLNVAAGDSLYRLPTEAEWEYAARAGTTTRWFFGDDPTEMCDYAWVLGSTCRNITSVTTCILPDGSQCGLKAVGLKRPNPWGLYDLYGNADEWVQDWWLRQYTEAPQVDPVQSVPIEPTEPGDFPSRMKRGRSFVVPTLTISSSERFVSEDEGSPGDLQTGFRLVQQEGAPTLTQPSSWGQIKFKKD